MSDSNHRPFVFNHQGTGGYVPQPTNNYHHDYPSYIQPAPPPMAPYMQTNPSSSSESRLACMIPPADDPLNMARMQSAMASMSIRHPGHVPTFSPFNPNAAPFHPQQYSHQPSAMQYSQPISYTPRYDAYTPSYHHLQYDQPYQDYPSQVQGAAMYSSPYLDNSGDLAAAEYDAMYATASASQQVALSPDLEDRLVHSASRKLLHEVQVGLEQLVTEADEFETWSGAIRERLVDRAMTPDGIGIAVEMAIEMAVLTPGVQYNFARLLVYLCGDVANLRDAMFPALQRMHITTRHCLAPEQLQNLLLFFAEIFTQLETESGSALRVLVTPIFEQLEGLLAINPVSDVIMKSVIQVLKLSGRFLDETGDDKQRMNKLLTKVQAIAVGCPTISESMKRQMKNLVELREANWGAKSNEAYQAESLAAGARFQGASSNGSLIMGPDGMPLSAEERAFLEENFGRLDSSGTDTVDDPEMLADYELFLAEQGNCHAIPGKDKGKGETSNASTPRAGSENADNGETGKGD